MTGHDRAVCELIHHLGLMICSTLIVTGAFLAGIGFARWWPAFTLAATIYAAHHVLHASDVVAWSSFAEASDLGVVGVVVLLLVQLFVAAMGVLAGRALRRWRAERRALGAAA